MPSAKSGLDSFGAEGPFDPASLVGSFFHSRSEPGWQGCVVAEPMPGVYLVELFSWVMGESTNQQLVRLDEMTGWRYDTDQWMNNAYKDVVQTAWDRERADAAGSTQV